MPRHCKDGLIATKRGSLRVVTCVSTRHGSEARPHPHYSGAQGRLDGYHTLGNSSGANKSAGEKKEGIHVFVNGVRTVPIPHRLDRSASRACACVSSEPAAGSNLAQTVDIRVERKRRRDLPNVSGNLYYGSQRAQTWRYRSSKTRGKPSRAVEGISEITAETGVFGKDDGRVSNSGNACGSERRVIQNENGERS